MISKHAKLFMTILTLCVASGVGANAAQRNIGAATNAAVARSTTTRPQTTSRTTVARATTKIAPAARTSASRTTVARTAVNVVQSRSNAGGDIGPRKSVSKRATTATHGLVARAGGTNQVVGTSKSESAGEKLSVVKMYVDSDISGKYENLKKYVELSSGKNGDYVKLLKYKLPNLSGLFTALDGKGVSVSGVYANADGTNEVIDATGKVKGDVSGVDDLYMLATIKPSGTYTITYNCGGMESNDDPDGEVYDCEDGKHTLKSYEEACGGNPPDGFLGWWYEYNFIPTNSENKTITCGTDNVVKMVLKPYIYWDCGNEYNGEKEITVCDVGADVNVPNVETLCGQGPNAWHKDSSYMTFNTVPCPSNPEHYVAGVSEGGGEAGGTKFRQRAMQWAQNQGLTVSPKSSNDTAAVLYEETDDLCVEVTEPQEGKLNGDWVSCEVAEEE